MENKPKYIYHTDKIEAQGYCDSTEVIQEWINSDPYPGYKLFQLNYTTSGHQSVWELKEGIEKTSVFSKATDCGSCGTHRSNGALYCYTCNKNFYPKED